ncbi:MULTISPECIES: lactate utilization protein C [Mycolicibacterium]|uniref:LutC/YkgG family protein n=1 Tax=Mycolicibacterium TaxID=1866885 RepID=UPI001CDC6847|nr:lactate utilization protein C [Mycolicibacterium fortuitum]UBV15764.1 lactate utilization protein C [Mycolicibacterium fortuitum]WAY20076.1 lactate utilization protein C [Mycolicibacterium fortuitum]
MTGPTPQARAAVLGQVRAALASAPPRPVQVPRDYHHESLTGAGDVERFAETVSEYRARVHRIDSDAIAPTVLTLVGPQATVVVPADLPSEWVAGLTTVTDEPALGVEQLDRADAVLTGCALGIAATGTIVLDAGRGQGRRALTLVPDHHICVVRVDQIVDTVPQAFAELTPTRPLTFISGPSATSDIELQRVEGVHGPRILDVLIVADLTDG